MKLETLNLPYDLRGLSGTELNELAAEIRQLLVSTVSTHGGHLASNMGVVELTLALHRVFESPKDKLVFDVGHQAYVHKILTGRAQAFEKSLRQRDGISGFTRRGESEHDAITAGHASTSISAALGLARARDLLGEKHHVVAIIGDGALTGGLSYEALNDTGHSQTRMIVVLNENDMSISRNVGALATYLTRLRQSRPYQRTKRAVRGNLERIPLIGRALAGGIDLIKGAFKYLFVRGQFFEALGFTYYGPVDGHDLGRLSEALQRAKEQERPVLVHVYTKKGRGYVPAENQPDHFHGVAPFFVETGEAVTSEAISYGQVAAGALIDAAKQDRTICAVIAAMARGTNMHSFGQLFPERIYDVGIAEEHAVTMAAGLAAGGMKPYVALYSTFLQRAYDEILHDVCLDALPVTLLVDRAGLTGEDGATHQGVMDISFLSAMPGMAVAAPRDIEELRRFIKWSAKFDAPLAIRYPKSGDELSGELPREPIALGTWEHLCEGEDVTILAVGRMVKTALSAASRLGHMGISAGVVNARFVKPLDEAMLKDITGAGRAIVTLEDGVLLGGFGSAVARAISDIGISKPPLCLGVPDAFIPHATADEQRGMCGLHDEQVARAVAAWLRGEGCHAS